MPAQDLRPEKKGRKTLEELEYEEQEERREYLQGLSDRLATEPIDIGWRNQTEPVISTLLPQHLGEGVTVGDVECASTVCRAEVLHPDSARLEQQRIVNFFFSRGELGKMQVQLDLSKEGATSFYFVKGKESAQGQKPTEELE